MSTEKGGKRTSLKRPVAEVRAALMADKDTQHIAKTLGVSLEEYVEKVLEYAQDLDKEPMITVVQDEAALKAAYPEVKTTQEVIQELQKYVSGEATFDTGGRQSDGFEAAKAPKVNVSGGTASAAGASAQPGSALQEQIQRQLKKGQTPKG